MILLRSGELPSCTIALFGHGLIGPAIVSELEGRRFANDFVASALPFVSA